MLSPLDLIRGFYGGTIYRSWGGQQGVAKSTLPTGRRPSTPRGQARHGNKQWSRVGSDTTSFISFFLLCVCPKCVSVGGVCPVLFFVLCFGPTDGARPGTGGDSWDLGG